MFVFSGTLQIHAENGDAVALGQQKMIEQGIFGPEGHGMSRPSILEVRTYRTVGVGLGLPYHTIHRIEVQPHFAVVNFFTSSFVLPSNFVCNASEDTGGSYRARHQTGGSGQYPTVYRARHEQGRPE